MHFVYAVLSFVACLALEYFSAFSLKRYNFMKKKKMKIKCVFWFYLHLSEKVLILSRMQLDVTISAHRPPCTAQHITATALLSDLTLPISAHRPPCTAQHSTAQHSTLYCCHIVTGLEFFLHILFRNPPIENITKISPVGAEVFHADEQTHMTNPIFALRNFANELK
jgi:hypothetical protein